MNPMAFRTVVISNPAELHAKGGQLQIWGDEKISVPMEDILVLLIESPQVKLSAACSSILAEHDVMTIFCDNTHHPSAYLCAYLPHSRQAQMAQVQFDISLPLRKRIWQRIIVQKILNQAACLDYASCENADLLRQYADEVLSGDSKNREGAAARKYFPSMFDGLLRCEDSEVNDALNYGYSIVRAAIARSLTAHGLYPPIGIHHKSEFNNFNLADDLIEPFRPFVDIFVKAEMPESCFLSKADRLRLVSVLHNTCQIDGNKTTIASGIELEVTSFIKALREKDSAVLKLPVFVELNSMVLR